MAPPASCCSKIGTCPLTFLLVFSYRHNRTPVWAEVSGAFQFLTASQHLLLF